MFQICKENFYEKYYLTGFYFIFNCLFSQDCEPGYTEINELCFHEGDLRVLQKLIDNSYQSGIDLGCEEWDPYCGSPNPFMDADDLDVGCC